MDETDEVDHPAAAGIATIADIRDFAYLALPNRNSPTSTASPTGASSRRGSISQSLKMRRWSQRLFQKDKEKSTHGEDSSLTSAESSLAARRDLTNVHFNYPQLDPRTRQIRLVTIDSYREQDADGRRTLECNLRLASLNSPSHYCALSYVWGTDAAEHVICLDGVAFKIRCNLFDFLTTIGFDKYQGVPIFIDALCIDQSSLAEREQQVGLMRDVYAGATEVIAWLGPVLIPRPGAGAVAAKMIMATAPSVIRRTEALFYGQNACMAAHANAMAFARAYRSPFWTRLWIVQEILLAKKLSLHIGEVVTTYDELLDWKRSSEYQSHWLGAGPGEGDDITDLVIRDFFRRYFAEFRVESILRHKRRFAESSVAGHEIPLNEVLTTYGGQSCGEPRDIVFGLLGLAESRVMPDYTLHLSHLYLYVLIEGIYEIAEALPSDADKSKRRERQLGFVGVAMRAFGYSATQLAVMHLTLTALQRCDLDEGEFIGCWNSLLASQRSELLCVRSPSKGASILVWILDLIYALQTCVPYVIPGWLRFPSFPLFAVFLMLRYMVLDLIMIYVEETNCTLSMPDGEKRTFARWTNVVDHLIALHDEEEPPSNVRFMEDTLPPSEAYRPRDSIFTPAAVGTVIDWGVQVAISLGFAWAGVRLGAWLDGKAAVLIEWVW